MKVTVALWAAIFFCSAGYAQPAYMGADGTAIRLWDNPSPLTRVYARPAPARRSGEIMSPVRFVLGGAGNGATPPPAGVTFSLPTGDSVHFMSASGSDSNNGLSTGAAWLTPNHALNCGDVIIAATGNYNPLTSWGSVSNCPSTSGGIDGTGGINFAIVLCAGNVGTCSVNHSTGHTFAVDVSANNWAVEGWLATEGYVSGASGFGFTMHSCTGLIHHVAFINNISAFNASGFTTNSCGANGGPGFGVDYYAWLGNIAQDSAGRNDGDYDAAFDTIGEKNFDTTAGTHVLIDGNFSYNNQQTTGGATDGECFMVDTPDALDYTQTIVIKNNIAAICERFGLQMFYQNESTNTGMVLKVYNNSMYGSNILAHGTQANGNYGDINIQANSTLPWTVTIQNNLVKERLANGTGDTGEVIYALVASSSNTSLTIGGSGSQNFLKGLATSCGLANCDSGFNAATNGSLSVLGTNTYTDPGYNSVTDLFSNQIGTPSCSSFATTTACLGWNNSTQAATNPSLIYDMLPTASGTSGKGYQPPGSCATDADYPSWLKGINVLSWNSGTSTITENTGLTNKPCSM